MSANGPREDLTGQTFGLLTVVSFIPGDKHTRAQWYCLCSCGQQRKNSTNQLLSGRSRSCGCAKLEAIGSKKQTHGHTIGRATSRTYRIWTNMKTRCSNPNASNFHWYGGRGISYADEWESFSVFLADMGECPAGLTLERRDVNAGYSKNNCIWASQKLQMRNTSKTVWLQIDGKCISLPEAAERYGVRPATLWARINRGWSHYEAVRRGAGVADVH